MSDNVKMPHLYRKHKHTRMQLIYYSLMGFVQVVKHWALERKATKSMTHGDLGSIQTMHDGRR